MAMPPATHTLIVSDIPCQGHAKKIHLQEKRRSGKLARRQRGQARYSGNTRDNVVQRRL